MKVPENPTPEQVEAAAAVAEDVMVAFNLWVTEAHKAVVAAATTAYLAFQDAGLLPPLYDSASTCSTIEEEWDLFV